MSNDQNEEPKLIIDEDWKTQVQREKERLKQQKSLEPEDATCSGSAEDQPATMEHPSIAKSSSESSGTESLSDEKNQEKENQLQPPPPATFEFLVSGMATQAVAAMGQLPGDDDQPLPVRLDYARHYIDLLSIIETKTAGNLSDAEQRFLQNTLHQLRMLFVSVKK